MSRIFITGASGNVGRPVAAELSRRGHEVVALVHENPCAPGSRSVTGSLSEAARYASEVASTDGVIHLASTMSVDRNIAIREDILGTGILLDNWRKGNFVYASSQTVYGIPQGPLTEAHPLSPMCWYDIAKVCCEEQLEITPPVPGRGAGVSLRIPPLFCPGKSGRGVRFLANIYAHCAKRHVFAFESEAALETAGTSFIGPEDLARAFADSLGFSAGGAYNISGGFCTWRSLIETMCEIGRLTPKFALLSGLPLRSHYVRMPQSRSYVDFSRFAAVSGFVPAQDLEELISDFVRKLA